MRVIYPGHRYELRELDGTSSNAVLQFVQRRPHHDPRPGTTNQEVCRALIDRIKVLDAEVPWVKNADILESLRHVIVLHEVRAYQRHHSAMPYADAMKAVSRFLLAQACPVEAIPVGDDGHWVIP